MQRARCPEMSPNVSMAKTHFRLSDRWRTRCDSPRRQAWDIRAADQAERRRRKATTAPAAAKRAKLVGSGTAVTVVSDEDVGTAAAEIVPTIERIHDERALTRVA